MILAPPPLSNPRSFMVSTDVATVLVPAIAGLVPVLVELAWRDDMVGGAFSKILTGTSLRDLAQVRLTRGGNELALEDVGLSLPIYGDVGESIEFAPVEVASGSIRLFVSYGYIPG